MKRYKDCALICNDDGKLMTFPLNRALFDEKGNIVDIIAGTFFICSAPSNSENFEGLTDEQIKKYKKHFRALKVFITY